MTGMYEMQVPDFNLADFADAACRGHGNLKIRADAFLSAVTPKVVEVIHYLYATEPDYVRQEYEGKPVIEVFFAGPYKGRPGIFSRGLILENGKLKDEIDEAVHDDEGLFSGANDHIVTYINTHSAADKKPTTENAKRYVEMEANAHPDIVGGPISIVILDGTGHIRWKQQGTCDVGSRK
jgi:hypothetical protein